MRSNEEDFKQERNELWDALKCENIAIFDIILSEILVRKPSIEEAWAIFKIASDTDIQTHTLRYILHNTHSPEDIHEVIHCALYHGWSHIAHLAHTHLLAYKQKMAGVLPRTAQDCWRFFFRTESVLFQEVILEHICTHHVNFENILKVRLCGSTFPLVYKKAGLVLQTLALK